MNTETLVRKWFQLWEKGLFEDLPISEDFQHHSPFGVITGKESYLNLVRNNKDKFLGYSFDILDLICAENHACVRYKSKQGDFELEVSEWHYIDNGLIHEIFAYYHIGEIRQERKLDSI